MNSLRREPRRKIPTKILLVKKTYYVTLCKDFYFFSPSIWEHCSTRVSIQTLRLIFVRSYCNTVTGSQRQKERQREREKDRGRRKERANTKGLIWRTEAKNGFEFLTLLHLQKTPKIQKSKKNIMRSLWRPVSTWSEHLHIIVDCPYVQN